MTAATVAEKLTRACGVSTEERRCRGLQADGKSNIVRLLLTCSDVDADFCESFGGWAISYAAEEDVDTVKQLLSCSAVDSDRPDN